jgi:hypothetical protein
VCLCVCIDSTNVNICYDLKRTNCNILINPKLLLFKLSSITLIRKDRHLSFREWWGIDRQTKMQNLNSL